MTLTLLSDVLLFTLFFINLHFDASSAFQFSSLDVASLEAKLEAKFAIVFGLYLEEMEIAISLLVFTGVNKGPLKEVYHKRLNCNLIYLDFFHLPQGKNVRNNKRSC